MFSPNFSVMAYIPFGSISHIFESKISMPDKKDIVSTSGTDVSYPSVSNMFSA
jgi:hypothetical protein